MKPYNHVGVRGWAPKLGFKDITKPDTHLLLDGGRLHVSMGTNPLFCKLLADDIDNNVSNFVTELRTPIFKMHIDLDVYDPVETPMSPELLREWVREMIHVMRDFFPHIDDNTTKESYDSFTVIICTTPTKFDVEKHKIMWAKTGAHVIFPWLLVDVSQAIKLRSGLIQHFEKIYGRRHKYNIWEDVFDMQIYQSNGLRMIGSSKMANCRSCKGRPSKEQMCDSGQCDGSGKYDAKRCYRVTDALDRNGQPDNKLLSRIRQSSRTEVILASIRTPVLVPMRMDVPSWFEPMFFHDEEMEHKNRFKPTPAIRTARRLALGELPENVLGAEELGLHKAPKLKAGDPICVAIQKWIRAEDTGIPDVYRNAEVVDITILQGDTNPFYIVRTDSLFCLNKGGEHNNNGVYFLINERGMYQKCFCQCDTTENRLFGKCKDYHSSAYIIPFEIRRLLYPRLCEQEAEAYSKFFTTDLSCIDEDKSTKNLLLSIKESNLQARIERIRARGKTKIEKQYNSKRI